MADSFGAKLWAKSKADGAVWTEVGDVISGDAIKLKKNVTERKHLGQPNRAVKKRGGFTDGGELSFKIVFDDDKFAYLKTWFDAPGPYDVRVETVNEEDETKVDRFASEGVLAELSLPLDEAGGRMESDIMIAVSGDVTFTAAATATAAT